MSSITSKNTKKNTKSSTIDSEELLKFELIAEQWWDEDGKFKPLHLLNPTRIKFIQDISKEYFKISDNSKVPLEKLEILDIGCGGGLLAEPIARLGGIVTAIDASKRNINVAKAHSGKMNLNINYKCTTVEELSTSKEKFDIILNMEVIEHVANIENFIYSSSKMLKKNGIMFISTLNRTIKSYLLAIIGGEYILKWLPKGTHDWKKFLKPSEINELLQKNGIKLKIIQGVSYNPLTNNWYLSQDINVNYIMVATKT